MDRRLVKLACQHQKAAVRADHQNATDPGGPFGEALKPANRRTGRPTWSSPDLAIVEGLAERALTHAQLAARLGIERKKMRGQTISDEGKRTLFGRTAANVLRAKE